MKPKTVTYNPGMQITNTDHLPKGTGSKYLEVLDNGSGPFIAVQWRRTKPASLSARHILVEFSKLTLSPLHKPPNDSALTHPEFASSVALVGSAESLATSG